MEVPASTTEPPAEKRRRMLERLAQLYGGEAAPGAFAEIERLIGGHRRRTAGSRRRSVGSPGDARPAWSEQDALLITYGDSLLAPGASPLAALDRFLARHVGGRALTFVHLLPFFPSTSDDGFSVVDFREVRGDLGGWRDVARLSRRHRLAFDAVLNHVSAESAYVRGFLAGDPRFRGFLVEVPPGADTSAVVRPRDLPLVHAFRRPDGTSVDLWTTFSRDQVDLNFAEPRVLLEILDVLLLHVARGASMLRLDAIPYLWKRMGTGCIHLRETHIVIKLIRDVLDLAAPQVILLSETNVPHAENISYFGDAGDEAQMIYNFSLAPLVLFALTTGDGTKLTRWAENLGPYWRGCTWLNITATHDGIGMRPTEGILTEAERGRLVDLARAHGGDVSHRRNPDGTRSPYELNITWFDAINDPHAAVPPELEVARFLVSQAIPMALKGIPGIYIHSLLGSRNDLAGVARSGRARSINRERLSVESVERELADPGHRRSRVLRGMLRLLHARTSHPAFHPDSDQMVLDLDPSVFAVLRREHATGRRVLALHNLSGRPLRLDRHRIPIGGPLSDLVTEQLVWLGEKGEDIHLLPYQVAWLA